MKNRSLNYVCIKGFTKNGKVICTTGDEISIHTERSDKNIDVQGLKGWCKDFEFYLSPDEFVNNFELL